MAKLFLYSGTALVTGVAITRRDPGKLGLPAAIGVIVGPVLWFESQRRALEFGIRDLPTLLGSDWGTNWIFVVAAAFVAAAGLHFANRGYGGRLPMTMVQVGALALAITVGGLGHANADDRWPLAARALDAVHVLAMGSWVGVLVLAYSTSPAADFSRWRQVSKVAIIAAPLAFATGLLSAIRILGPPAPAEMIGWPYGRLLMSKVFLVLLMLGLGAVHNRKLLARQLPSRFTLRLEVVLAALVVLVTAFLTGTSPPE